MVSRKNRMTDPPPPFTEQPKFRSETPHCARTRKLVVGKKRETPGNTVKATDMTAR